MTATLADVAPDLTHCVNRHIVAIGPQASDAVRVLAAQGFTEGAAVVSVVAGHVLPSTPWALAIDHVDVLALPAFRSGSGTSLAPCIERIAGEEGGAKLIEATRRVMRSFTNSLAQSDTSASSGFRWVAYAPQGNQEWRECVSDLERMAEEAAAWNGPALRITTAVNDIRLEHDLTVARLRFQRGAVCQSVRIPCRSTNDIRALLGSGWWPLVALDDRLEAQVDPDAEDRAIAAAWASGEAPVGRLGQRASSLLIGALAADGATSGLAKRLGTLLAGTVAVTTWWTGFRVVVVPADGSPRTGILLDDLLQAAAEREAEPARKILCIDARIISAHPADRATLEQAMRIGRKYGLEVMVCAADAAQASCAAQFAGTWFTDEPATGSTPVLQHLDQSTGAITRRPMWWGAPDLIAARRLHTEGSAP